MEKQIDSDNEVYLTAFDKFDLISSGIAPDVVAHVKEYIDRTPDSSILVFDDESGEVVDIDFRGEPEQVVKMYQRRLSMRGPTDSLITSLKDSSSQTGPGRPKLGVVGREVTLLPRHWEWLNSQPGGSSVALRKLVEEARRGSVSKDKIRLAQERTYRFMSSLCGDLPKYEEALRSLYAKNIADFKANVSDWPKAVQQFSLKLAEDAFTE